MIDTQATALIVTLIGMAVGGVWKLSRVESALRKDITDSKQEIEEKQNQHSREFGETIAAIRQKVAEVELYAANTYVRRDGFYKVRDELSADIKTAVADLKADLRRMETKIDSKT